MADQDAAQSLSEMPLFAATSLEDLQALASRGRRRKYKRNEVIFHQDDPPGYLFVLLEGYVKVTLASPDGRQMTLAWVRPGNVFGTISVLDEGPQPETGTAGSACDVIVVEAKVFRDVLATHPEAAMKMLRSLAVRWRSSVEQLQDMAFLDINARLAKVLLNVAQPHELPAADRVAALAGNVSQSQLASLIGASRESVNKSLQYFVHQGCIELHDGRIEILDAGRLEGRFS